MKSILKEQINKALKNSHGRSYTYDDLFKNEPSDIEDDRCLSTHSIEQFESEFEELVNNKTPRILVYIQVDDCDAFKAECFKLDDDDDITFSSYPDTFTIGDSGVLIGVD